jgi:hypothetical protein
MKYYSQKKIEKKLGKKLFPKTHLDNRRPSHYLTVSSIPMIGNEITIGKRTFESTTYSNHKKAKRSAREFCKSIGYECKIVDNVMLL